MVEMGRLAPVAGRRLSRKAERLLGWFCLLVRVKDGDVVNWRVAIFGFLF